MISIILLSFLFLFILSNNFQSINTKKEVLISDYITAFILSITIIGLISMGLIFTHLSNFPIFIIVLGLSLSYIFLFKLKMKNIENFLRSFNLIFNTYKKEFRPYKLSIILMVWLFFISLGPINHPDTTTTYVGYPYQFFLNNKHFIDGGLHQGLLGIADFANISFFQEGTVWLIRSIQAVPILFLVSIFLNRKTNNYLLVSFLSSPIFIQWLTIGKYLFLPDMGITINYLVWSRFKGKNTLLNLIIVILLSLTFKISCLIISIPIVFHIFNYYLKKNKILSIDLKRNLPRINFLILSIFALLIILSYRFYITGNMFYPIFNSYFIPDNQEMIDFENYLRNFMRSSAFPLSLIITNNINFLGLIIGPATGAFLIIISLANISQIRKKLLSDYQFVGLIQLILLLTLSQGRGDYYASPIILIFLSGNNYLNNFLYFLRPINFKNIFSKLIPKILLFIQISIFLSITLISGYQTIYSIIDYQSYMNRYAYNFDITQTLNKYAKEPVMNIGNRTALLFLNKKYIHEDRYKKCKNNRFINDENIFDCARILKANSVIIYGDSVKNNKDFSCNKYNSIETSRNPFRLRKKIFHICNISKAKD